MGLLDIFKSSKKEGISKSTKQITDPLADLFQKSYDDAGLRPLFYKQLLSSELIILKEKSSGDEISVRPLPDGKIPIFTHTDRIFDNEIITTQVSFLGITGRDLFDMTKGDTLVLNPFSELHKILTPEEISSMLDGSIFNVSSEKIQQETKVRLGIPSVIPSELKDAVLSYCSTKSEITACYIAMIDRGEGPNLFVGLKVNSDDETVFGELGAVLRTVNQTGRKIEFARIEDSGSLAKFFNSIEPVYKK